MGISKADAKLRINGVIGKGDKEAGAYMCAGCHHTFRDALFDIIDQMGSPDRVLRKAIDDISHNRALQRLSGANVCNVIEYLESLKTKKEPFYGESLGGIKERVEKEERDAEIMDEQRRRGVDAIRENVGIGVALAKFGNVWESLKHVKTAIENGEPGDAADITSKIADDIAVFQVEQEDKKADRVAWGSIKDVVDEVGRVRNRVGNLEALNHGPGSCASLANAHVRIGKLESKAHELAETRQKSADNLWSAIIELQRKAGELEAKLEAACRPTFLSCDHEWCDNPAQAGKVCAKCHITKPE